MNENERRLAREHMKLTDPDDSIEHMGTVRFIVKCNKNAPEILKKAKEILLLANEKALVYPKNYDDNSYMIWSNFFPQWFIDACEPNMSFEERKKQSEWIVNLPFEQKVEYARAARWSVIDWVSWLLPEDRIWIWWDAICTDYDTIVVAVEVTDWPFPWDNLRWLFRACGAISVEAEV